VSWRAADEQLKNVLNNDRGGPIEVVDSLRDWVELIKAIESVEPRFLSQRRRCIPTSWTAPVNSRCRAQARPVLQKPNRSDRRRTDLQPAAERNRRWTPLLWDRRRGAAGVPQIELLEHLVVYLPVNGSATGNGAHDGGISDPGEYARRKTTAGTYSFIDLEHFLNPARERCVYTLCGRDGFIQSPRSGSRARTQLPSRNQCGNALSRIHDQSTARLYVLAGKWKPLLGWGLLSDRFTSTAHSFFGPSSNSRSISAPADVR